MSEPIEQREVEDTPSRSDLEPAPRSCDHAEHVCFIAPYIEAYLRPGSLQEVGGAERQQYLLAQKLRDEGHAVSFISFETDDDVYERLDGFDVWRTLPRTNDPIRAPEALLKVFQSIRRVDADVFYLRGNPPLCILTSYACKILGEALVYAVANDSNLELSKLPSHHGLFKYTLPRLAYLDAIRRANRVVSQTDYQRGILEDVFGIDATVVPNGYTVPSEAEIAPPSERQHVLWVGSLDPGQKRPERFIRLAERVPRGEFRMIGWTNDEEYRQKIVRKAEEIPNLTFAGFVAPDQIHTDYRRAVTLVNTSEHEGFPNTFLEAWRYGVPVVSLNYTLDGVITERQIGYHAGTMDEMERIVEMLWDDPDGAAAMGRDARRYFEAHYTIDTVFDAYERIFAEAVGSKL